MVSQRGACITTHLLLGILSRTKLSSPHLGCHTMTTTELFQHGKHKLDSWAFSGEFGRHFGATFNLQMWCFGCDIRRPEGNLLLSYGFSRLKPPGDTYGSTHYTLDLGTHTKLHLLGFAIALEDATSGLLLKRYERSPRLFKRQPIPSRLHRPHQLPNTFSPIDETERRESTRLLALLSQELSCYEEFIEKTTSTEFQISRRSSAPRISHLPKQMQLKQAWNSLALLAQGTNPAPAI